jgi:orotate phosphoribosyltransferase
MDDLRDSLKKLIEDRCLLTGDFTLSTGAPSKYYFDCKRATLHGESLSLIADLLLEEALKLPEPPEAIGGLTLGADPIVAAVIMRAYQTGKLLVQGSIARKEHKKHGTMNRVENVLPVGTKIVVVDDVLTSGKSSLEACKRFEEEGYRIVGVLGIVDREQEAPARKILKEKYQHVRALFSIKEFPHIARLLADANAKAAVAG